MSILNILVATSHLNRLGGSVTFTYALVEELKMRSNVNVEYFTFEKGIVSDRIENNLDVRFLSRNRYDLILANHNTVVERLYGLGFIIQTCHGIFPDLEQPSYLSDAYVGISQEVMNHISKISKPSLLIYNGINLNRFRSIRPISKKLKTVLSLCQSETANSFIEKICLESGYYFLASNKYKNPTWSVEEVINNADLVIGLGRSAYEAMSCGRPVIIYDDRSYFPQYGDGYLSHNLGLSLLNNCSGRYFKRKILKEEFKRELEKYDPSDGFMLREFAENELDISSKLDQYLNFWQEIVDQKKMERKYVSKFRLKRLIGKKTVLIAYRIKKNLIKKVKRL